jgi:dTDP-4-amino-4,6-dideoxygalactose transaminase
MAIAKYCTSDLAVFGGPRSFSEALHVGRPNVAGRAGFHKRTDAILDRGWLTNSGPELREFEHRLQERLGVAHCLATCSGTAGLGLAIRAAGLTGEVIVPSFTFVATAHVLLWHGITPVFCDINPRTLCIDAAGVEALITPRTTGILGVHLWGRACDVDGLTDVARRRGLTLLFDAAQAFGCSHGGKMIGNFGAAEVFSFHATKVMNTFEGGAVTTNDSQLADRLRAMRNFGFAGGDTPMGLGTNAKLNELSAAMGLVGLEHLDEFIAHNLRNCRHYEDGLAGLAGVRWRPYPRGEASNYHYAVVEVDAAESGIGRDDLMDVLQAENVLARRYFFPGCHQVEPYRSLYPASDARLPHTAALSQRTLLLPTGMAVSPGEVDAICELIRFVVGNGREVAMRLTGKSSGTKELTA